MINISYVQYKHNYDIIIHEFTKNLLEICIPATIIKLYTYAQNYSIYAFTNMPVNNSINHYYNKLYHSETTIMHTNVSKW